MDMSSPPIAKPSSTIGTSGRSVPTPPREKAPPGLTDEELAEFQSGSDWEAIERGLADAEAGRVFTLDEVDAELSLKHGLPRSP